MAPLTLGAAASNYGRHATNTMNWYLANTLRKLLAAMRYHHPAALNLSPSFLPDSRLHRRSLSGPAVVGDSMQLRVRILNVSWVLNLSGFTFSIRNKRKHIQHVAANVFSTRRSPTLRPSRSRRSVAETCSMISMVSHETSPSVYGSPSYESRLISENSHFGFRWTWWLQHVRDARNQTTRIKFLAKIKTSVKSESWNFPFVLEFSQLLVRWRKGSRHSNTNLISTPAWEHHSSSRHLYNHVWDAKWLSYLLFILILTAVEWVAARGSQRRADFSDRKMKSSIIKVCLSNSAHAHSQWRCSSRHWDSIRVFVRFSESLFDLEVCLTFDCRLWV